MNRGQRIPRRRHRLNRAAFVGSAAVTAVLFAAGCGGDGAVPEPLVVPRGNALVSRIVENGVTNYYRASVRTPMVSIATMDDLRVESSVTIESVAPLRITPGLELLEARVNFVIKKGVHGFTGFPGWICTDRWPPTRFVDLLEAPDLEVGKGDQIAVTFFARAERQGDYEMAGLRIRYREGGLLKEQTTESSTVTIQAREAEENLDPTAKCPPTVGNHWLGDRPGSESDHVHDGVGDSHED